MKKSRNEEMIKLRNKGHTMQSIGDKFGITRERVRQILMKRNGTTEMDGLITRYKLSKIIGCADATIQHYEQLGEIKPKRVGNFFLYKKSDIEKIASIVRRSILPDVMLVCKECGEIFSRRPYTIRPRSPGNYCSKRCSGKVVGRKYGFKAHKENIGRKKKKYDYEKIYKAKDENGWSATKISNEFCMPLISVYRILDLRRESAAKKSF